MHQELPLAYFVPFSGMNMALLRYVPVFGFCTPSTFASMGMSFSGTNAKAFLFNSPVISICNASWLC